MMTVKPKLVSLLANWYSGATLLTILLNAHSEIVSNGESMFFDENDNRRYDCSCGKYIDECEFYEAATRPMRLPDAAGWDKRLFVQVPRFSRKPLLRSLLHSPRLESALRHEFIDIIPIYRNVRNRFLEAQLQFFAKARELSGASIYLDGTKSIRRAQLFARDDRCAMRVLHLVRDGRGFCASYVKNMRPVPTWTDAADAWMSYVEQVNQFSRAFPSVPVLLVRYEDLCRSTAEVIRAVCQFLEISYEEPPADMMKDAHILGNRMRRTFSGAIAEDTSWKQKLDKSTQMELTSLMKRQLQQFGYL
jgi:Sulfotransferase family